MLDDVFSFINFKVTIPFDYDYRESKEPVECACNTLLVRNLRNFFSLFRVFIGCEFH